MSKINIRPLSDNVIVKPSEESESTTPGGIIIPDTAKEKSQEGEVIAVAKEGCEPIKVGDLVVYESFSGSDITIQGHKHIILKIKDVLGILKR